MAKATPDGVPVVANARQFDAYSRRGTGNQRHTLSHDSMLLNICTIWTPGICTRPQALAGRQAIRKHTVSIKVRSCLLPVAFTAVSPAAAHGRYIKTSSCTVKSWARDGQIAAGADTPAAAAV